MALEKELATYECSLSSLQDQEGKFVLVQDSKIEGIYDTYDDALKVGYERFGTATPFLVKQIQIVEQVQFVTRHLTFPCPT